MRVGLRSGTERVGFIWRRGGGVNSFATWRTKTQKRTLCRFSRVFFFLGLLLLSAAAVNYSGVFFCLLVGSVKRAVATRHSSTSTSSAAADSSHVAVSSYAAPKRWSRPARVCAVFSYKKLSFFLPSRSENIVSDVSDVSAPASRSNVYRLTGGSQKKT